MAGFGEGQGVFHSFLIANLADEDDVGCLAQGVFQGGEPVVGVHADFALGNDAVFVRMDEFDRVFNGNNVAVAVFIAVVDHGGQRSGFARACAADENHQPAFLHGDFFQHFGQFQVVHFRNHAVDDADDECHRAALNHGVDTETRHAVEADGKVTFFGVFEFFALFFGHDGLGDCAAGACRQRAVADGGQLAVKFDGRRKFGRDEEV